MGWHNVGEAGIDRRGINAAINALLVMGRRALADLEEALGNRARAAELRAMADEMAGKIAKRFLSPADGLFHDGELDGQLLPQVSEQTNTWAIAAGCADSQQARTILLKLLTEDDPSVARNGPYFWTYLFPLLNELDLHQIGCEKIRKAWGKMVDAQSSTLWETFKGDNLDSWCHPWSSAPAEFLLTGILGLPASCLPGETITLRPRYDLISEAGGRIMTAAGAISVAWKTSNSGNVEFEGDLPSGVCATVVLKDGRREPVKGRWKLTI